jgi:ABC-type uncharacterized transport system fused permease/ATPase subunit
MLNLYSNPITETEYIKHMLVMNFINKMFRRKFRTNITEISLRMFHSNKNIYFLREIRNVGFLLTEQDSVGLLRVVTYSAS